MEISRRNFLKSTATLAAITVSGSGMLLLEGCPITQSQLAQLVAEVGTGLSGILPYLKSVSATAAANVESAFSALEGTVQGWKPGGAVSDVEQAVNAFVANLALIPVLAEYQPLISLIVATAEGIVTLLVPNPAPPVSLKAGLFVAQANAKYPHPPKTARSFRREWNRVAHGENRADLTIN